MEISEKIHRLRTENGMTQAELAKIAGVSDKAVSTWENGLKEPRLGPVQRICSHFSIDLNAFVDTTSDVYSSGPLPSPALTLTPAEETLVTDYRRLTPNGQEYIRQTMAIALQAYSEKNHPVSHLETAQ